MVDEVTPLPRGSGPGSLYSFNGIGFQLKGFTRKDGAGYRFATRWFTIAGLPVIPLSRYYVREHPLTVAGRPGAQAFSTRYDFAGSTSLRIAEILRTYAFFVVSLTAGVWPVIAVLKRADDFGIWISLGMVVLWPIGFIIIVNLLLTVYRDRWAPQREVRWTNVS